MGCRIYTTVVVAFMLSLFFCNSCPPTEAADFTHATVYSLKYAGKKTACGKRFNPNALTAASKYYPMGAKVLVQNQKNGKQVAVTINDRGGNRARKLDLSPAAARRIGIHGVALVKVTRLGLASRRSSLD